MSRPNIMHILVDQQRTDTIGALNNPIIKTPSLYKLVKLDPTILGSAGTDISTHKTDGIDLYHLIKFDIGREFHGICK